MNEEEVKVEEKSGNSTKNENEVGEKDENLLQNLADEVKLLREELKSASEAGYLKRVEEINCKNRALSPGVPDHLGASLSYTREEVAKMSQREVRENFDAIKASMKKW